jgi:hypothetical protein
MSIELLLKDQVKRRMLFPVVPKAPGSASRRVLLASEELWAVLNSAEGNDEWEKRVAELQADLEVFVEGGPIDPKYLFLLYPSEDCVWEIRSTRSNPSIRVLGLFAKRDMFIATNYAFRDDLGGWQSREWKQVKRNARAKWRGICLTYQPLKGTDVRKFVTGALNGEYLKR